MLHEKYTEPQITVDLKRHAEIIQTYELIKFCSLYSISPPSLPGEKQPLRWSLFFMQG